ncbi:MAG TPA: cellulose synthase family protein [Planctomycetota bacterium]|nr:cellulose synthase family protein [Planctomycetota bacterium]
MYTYFVVLGLLCLYGFHRYLMVYLYYRHARRAAKIEKRFEALPVVTVQLPLFNELYVTERLIDAACALDYPREKLQIQVLDDSTDESVEVARRKVDEWKAKGVDIEYVHRTDRTGYKAGALDNGLKTAKGEFVALFDADFVPNPDFLQQTVHHFTDAKVGCVQARWGHINKEYSILTRLQSIFLDGHFVMEHAARNRSGRFFNFSGTAGLWRTSAIADAGGWQHDTLTEDLDLSFRAQLKGWRFVFVQDVVTPAELPVDMNGFKSQQHRWVKGSMQTSKKLLKDVIKAPIPLHVKSEGVVHLMGNTAYLLTLFLALMLFPVTYFRPKLEMKTSVLLDLVVFASATLSVCVFYLTSQKELYGLRGVLRTILYTPMLLSMGIGMCISNARAVIEGLTSRGGEFVRTPKYAIHQNRDTFVGKKYKVTLKRILPFLELAIGLGFGWVIYYSFMHQMYGAIPFQMLFFVGFTYVAFLSLFQGRLTAR